MILLNCTSCRKSAGGSFSSSSAGRSSSGSTRSLPANNRRPAAWRRTAAGSTTAATNSGPPRRAGTTTQQWPGPPDAVLDGQPYRVERLDHGAAVRLTSRDDPRSGIRFSRVIRIAGDSTRVSFEATMTNVDTQAAPLGHLGAHATRRRPGRRRRAQPLLNAWCPLNPQSQFPKGYRVIFGTEDNPSFQPDPRAA